MTTKKSDDPDDSPLGVLDDAASVDTAGIGILGGTAQVRVTLPIEEDDDLSDDEVVDGEVVGDLVIEDLVLPAPAVARPAVTVVESVESVESVGAVEAIEATEAVQGEPDIRERPVASETVAASDERATPVGAESVSDVSDVDPVQVDAVASDSVEDSAVPHRPATGDPVEIEPVRPDAAADVAAEHDSVDAARGGSVDVGSAAVTTEDEALPVSAVEDGAADADSLEVVPTEEGATGDDTVVAVMVEEGPEAEEPPARRLTIEVRDADRIDEPPSPGGDPAAREADEAAAAARFLAKADADAAAVSALTPRGSARKESPMSTPDDKSVVSQPTRTAPRTDVTLTSRRLGELGESARESADLLTADRLLDPQRFSKPEPEGGWSHFLYTVSGRRINIGDGRRARERKALTARIAAPLVGGARFVPVLSRKGGVGKTTITALLGMALADAREDRVIAVDANPDRGTLADRVVRPHHSRSVRDLVRIRDEVRGYHDISAIVARDATRLDVLASDADPRVAEAFSDSDYRDVATVAAHYYSLVLTDTGTGIVHSVMSATLDLSDQLVIVSGLSVDEARLASETLTWLETNGYTEQARDAIVVLNQSTPGTPLVRLNELQAHFATRVRSVVRVPYDPQIAGGGTIVFANLLPETRTAARELAALLVEGLRAKAA